jgi:hypothetical protein
MTHNRAAADNLRELLEQAGARIRSAKRADCPSCHKQYAVSFDAERGLFKCHGWSKETQQYCDFQGNVWMLKNRLGLTERLPPREYAAQMREMERERNARIERVTNNRELSKMLRGRLRQFDRIEVRAHERGAELIARGRQPGRVLWDALELVERKRPSLIETLDRIDRKPYERER